MQGGREARQIFVMSELYVIWAVLLWSWLGGGVDTAVVHEIYAEKENTNRSVACGVCEGAEGHLARRPEMNDWELAFGNWSHLEDKTFWVDLVKVDTGEWVWGDGELLDTNHISALPMSGVNGSGEMCAVWSMVEPFLLMANCSMTTNILCQRSSSSTPECDMSELTDTEITASNPALSAPQTFANKDDCVDACRNDATCWAGDWKSGGECRLLLVPGSTTTAPALPTLTPGRAQYVAFGKTCLHYEEMKPEDSEFVCNCHAIEIPETEEEKQQFLEEHKEEVQKELIVPTETLSATIRKKESAPDERQSSQTFGYVGVVIMVAVFGGLVSMDVVRVVVFFLPSSKTPPPGKDQPGPNKDEESSEA